MKQTKRIELFRYLRMDIEHAIMDLHVAQDLELLPHEYKSLIMLFLFNTLPLMLDQKMYLTQSRRDSVY